MSARRTRRTRRGFTLIEVLIALGLCVLLTSIAAAALTHTTRATRQALRAREFALQLSTLYTLLHLRPNDIPTAPLHGWRMETMEEFTPAPAALSESDPEAAPRRWTCLTLYDQQRERPPARLRILENTP